MNAVQRERLVKLCDFLESLPRERFNYSRWVGRDWRGAQDLSCGTTACAAGWGVVLFGKECGVELRVGSHDLEWAFPAPSGVPLSYPTVKLMEQAGEILFGVSPEDFDFLFCPDETSYVDDKDDDVRGPDGEDEEGKPFANASAKRVATHIRGWLDEHPEVESRPRAERRCRVISPRDQRSLQKALAVLRDPGGDGKTRVSHGFTGQPMRCVRCGLPTQEQAPAIDAWPPFCQCGSAP